MKGLLAPCLFSVALLLSGCSGQIIKGESLSKCNRTHDSILSKHIELQVNSQSKSLTRCFQNFLQFEENKKQTIDVCNRLNVARNGHVTYANVSGDKLPKDLQMCLEQELWTMNFRALQPNKNVRVQFPLTFSSH